MRRKFAGVSFFSAICPVWRKPSSLFPTRTGTTESVSPAAHVALCVVPSAPAAESFACISRQWRQPASVSAMCVQNGLAFALPRIPRRRFPAGANFSGRPVASENAAS